MKTSSDIDDLNYLWDEYKYRHDLIWRTMIRIAVVVITLAILPYTVDEEIAELLGNLILVPPLLAVLLVLFGGLLIRNELRLLSYIKETYRPLQNDFFQSRLGNRADIEQDQIPRHLSGRPSSFKGFVYFLFGVLLVLSVSNVVVLFLLGI
jgi:hypothetical protein